MRCWYPVYGHPEGPDLLPRYRIGPTGLSPMRDSRPASVEDPWFEVHDGFAYPTSAHPEGPSANPWYRVFGSFVYTTDHHPAGVSTTPWFQVR